MTPFLPNTEGIFFDLPEEVYRPAPGLSQSELKEFGETIAAAAYAVADGMIAKSKTP